MSSEVDCACGADTAQNVVWKQSAMHTVTAVRWCAVALLVLRFGHTKPHHQIEITSRTGVLSINERSGVPYHIIEVGRLAYL